MVLEADDSALQPRLVGRLDEGELERVGQAERHHLQHESVQVLSQDLRRRVLGHRCVILGRVEPVAHSGPGPACDQET